MAGNRSGKFVSTTEIGADLAAALARAPKGPTEDSREWRAAQALGVELVGLVRERPLSRTWRVRLPAPEAPELAMVIVADRAEAKEWELFSKMAQSIQAAGDALPSVLRVRAVNRSRDAFLTDLWTAGSARDLSALNWPPRRRVEFVLRAVRALEGLHAIGIVHGCLSPANVLLDDDLQPVLAEAGSVPVPAVARRGADSAGFYTAFAAPEVTKGADADVQSDIFSIGRILEEVMKGAQSHVSLIAIVGRATAANPGARYASAGELADALEAVVGLLPSTNTTPPTARVSVPPSVRPRREAAASKAPPPVKPSSKPPVKISSKPPPAWQPPRALGVVGVVAAGAAVAAAALLGGANETARVVLPIALVGGLALAITLARPPAVMGRAKGAALQLFVALACGAAVLFFDPLSSIYRAVALRHVHGDEATSRAAVAELDRLGSLRGVSLASLDLSGMDLSRADLRGTDLSRANLSKARLAGAHVQGASFDGAALAGADLDRVDLALASVGTATCDGDTRLPNGWRCDAGHIARSP